MNVRFKGLRNVLGESATLTYDGQHYSFKKNEVKILPEEIALFAFSRLKVGHEDPNNEKTAVVGRLIFKEVPLTEALKEAPLEENPSVTEAREQAEKRAAEKAALKAEILAELNAERSNRPVGRPAKEKVNA